MTLSKKTLGNIAGKGENAGNQHFLPFPLYQDENSHFSNNEFVVCKMFSI